MFIVTLEQQQKLAEVSYKAFYINLSRFFTQNHLLPDTQLALDSNHSLVKNLVQGAREVGLEYEYDIALHITLVLCGHIPSDYYDVANEQQEDEQTSFDEQSLDCEWMLEILAQQDSDGDEKMSIIEARWRRLCRKNETLQPSIKMLDALEKEF